MEFIDHGMLTTPQLHYLTANHDKSYRSTDYIKNMTEAYIAFTELSAKSDNKIKPHIVLDCANGVGAIPMQEI